MKNYRCYLFFCKHLKKNEKNKGGHWLRSFNCQNNYRKPDYKSASDIKKTMAFLVKKN